MFRSIGKSLDNRKESLQKHANITETVRAIVWDVVRDYAPDAANSLTIQYKEDQDILLIAVPQKALAGELLLRTTELRAVLNAHKIRVSRIVIR